MRLFVVANSLLVISRERGDSIAELFDYAVKLLLIFVAQWETEHNFKSIIACSIQANAGLVKSRLILASDEFLDRRIDIHDSHHPSFGGITEEIDLVVRGEVLSGRPFTLSRRCHLGRRFWTEHLLDFLSLIHFNRESTRIFGGHWSWFERNWGITFG